MHYLRCNFSQAVITCASKALDVGRRQRVGLLLENCFSSFDLASCNEMATSSFGQLQNESQSKQSNV